MDNRRGQDVHIHARQHLHRHSHELQELRQPDPRAPPDNPDRHDSCHDRNEGGGLLRAEQRRDQCDGDRRQCTVHVPAVDRRLICRCFGRGSQGVRQPLCRCLYDNGDRRDDRQGLPGDGHRHGSRARYAEACRKPVPQRRVLRHEHRLGGSPEGWRQRHVRVRMAEPDEPGCVNHDIRRHIVCGHLHSEGDRRQGLHGDSVRDLDRAGVG